MRFGTRCGEPAGSNTRVQERRSLILLPRHQGRSKISPVIPGLQVVLSTSPPRRGFSFPETYITLLSFPTGNYSPPQAGVLTPSFLLYPCSVCLLLLSGRVSPSGPRPYVYLRPPLRRETWFSFSFNLRGPGELGSSEFRGTRVGRWRRRGVVSPWTSRDRGESMRPGLQPPFEPGKGNLGPPLFFGPNLDVCSTIVTGSLLFPLYLCLYMIYKVHVNRPWSV